MTYKSKAVTANTPPLSLGENIAASARQYKQSRNMDNTPRFTRTSSQQSNLTLTTGKKGLEITENSRQHAALLKVVLSRLEKAGLVKRFRVLSKNEDGTTTVKKIQIEFDNTYWTESLDLRVLSEVKK